MSTSQITMSFATTRAVTRPADVAAQQAADNAENRNPRWIEKAYRALCDYIALHQGNEFTTEKVRSAAINVPTPPDDRAWGAIILKAKRAGLVKWVRYEMTKNERAHSRPVSVWTTP